MNIIIYINLKQFETNIINPPIRMMIWTATVHTRCDNKRIKTAMTEFLVTGCFIALPSFNSGSKGYT